MTTANEERGKKSVTFYIGWAAAMAIPAASVRMAVTHFESRYQILIFSMLSLAGELLASRVNGRPFDLHRALIGAVAAALAIVSVKWSIEGLPPVAQQILETLGIR